MDWSGYHSKNAASKVVANVHLWLRCERAKHISSECLLSPIFVIVLVKTVLDNSTAWQLYRTASDSDQIYESR